MDISHSLSTLMVVRPLEGDKDPFRPKDILGPVVPHLNAIGALLYLVNCICSKLASKV